MPPPHPRKGQTEIPRTGLCIPGYSYTRPTRPDPQPSIWGERSYPNMKHRHHAHKWSPPNAQSAQSVLNTLNTSLASCHCDEWNSHLESLSVQTKLLDVVQLEQQTHVWSQIIFSLSAGQMSFLIRAFAFHRLSTYADEKSSVTPPA